MKMPFIPKVAKNQHGFTEGRVVKRTGFFFFFFLRRIDEFTGAKNKITGPQWSHLV